MTLVNVSTCPPADQFGYRSANWSNRIEGTGGTLSRIWHVNSTHLGGGVSEILIGIQRAGDVDGISHQRFVTSTEPDVFQITKRLHHRLHGVDAGDLPDDSEHKAYLAYGHSNARRLLDRLQERDLVILHDPQTLPMAPVLAAAGAKVVWRCHIGTLASNAVSRDTWSYLKQFWPPELTLVFTDEALIPDAAAAMRVRIIAPSIDLNAPKNRFLPDSTVRDTLASIGLGPGPATSTTTEVISDEPLDADPIVLQVSRWDPLKDMPGVLRAFADSSLPNRSRLVLCGPSPAGISDDPEAAKVLAEVLKIRDELPVPLRRRVHLVCPDVSDEAGNARVVNALQRRATVVTQKSLQEGFGLTVTEAMAKARPVVASRVGGIPRQIEHRVTGLLLDDPTDTATFSMLVASLIDQPNLARTLGVAAAERVAAKFTTAREMAEHHAMYHELCTPGPGTGGEQTQ